MFLPVAILSCALLDGEATKAMPKDKAVVHFISLRRREPGSAVVRAPKPEDDKDSLLNALLEARNNEPDFPAGTPLALLTLGPGLDDPDRATVLSFTRQGNKLDLQIAHTRVREQGVKLRKNAGKQPLVQVPVEGLQPGDYSLKVTWTAFEAVLDGRYYRDPKLGDKRLAKVDPLVQTLHFQIRPK